MSESILSLLDARRAELACWEERLYERANMFQAARNDFWVTGQSSEVEEAAVRIVETRLQDDCDMEPWPDWHQCYYRAGDNTFASVDYLADTSIDDERWMAVWLPFDLLWFLRVRPRAYEICILGQPTQCLVLPGADLWNWIGVRWKRWADGQFSFVFRWDEQGQQCELRKVLQTRTGSQGREINLCQQGSVDVTSFLDRFEWLGESQDGPSSSNLQQH